MRHRTFFSLVIGCFIAGLLLALSFVVTTGVGPNPTNTVALSSK
jgi:hypothetical protein